MPMSTLEKILAAVLLILLAAAGYGWWYTSQPARLAARPGALQQAVDNETGIDQSTFVLARRLSAMAEGTDEQALAASAERLADHELDLAFTGALRRIEANPPVLSPAAQKIQDRLQKAQKLLDADQASVTQLTTALAQAPPSQRNNLQDQLDLATSQAELDKDEVAEANEDLLQAGGNQHQRVQMMIQEHTAAEQVRPAPSSASAQTAHVLSQGLIARVREWFESRRKQQWLLYATAQASANATRLSAERKDLATRLDALKAQTPGLAKHAKSIPAAEEPQPAPAGTPAPAPVAAATPAAAPTPAIAASAAAAQSHVGRGESSSPQSPSTDAPSLLTTTRRIAAGQKRLTLLDQRIAALTQLEGVYRNWNKLAGAATTSVLHSILLSVAIVLGIVLLLLFMDSWLRHLLGRTKLDRRQVETLRSVTRVGLQILGVVTILLIVIGRPAQLGTMIGLAGAGLTVALKDFIVAFIGWLTLMGRNGLRLGDWVEINGVSGEVVELNMFHTVLLETGNWTDAGHPTGRRVNFTNSFAIEGHYFNFSTSGQWLWDELLVVVPFDKDPNLVADAIHREVVSVTSESATQAEEEWRRTAAGRRGSVFA